MFSEKFKLLNDYSSKINSNEKNEEKKCCDLPEYILDNYTKINVCRNCGTCNNKGDNIDYNDIVENNKRGKINNILLPKSSMVTYIKGYSQQFNFLKQVHLYHKPTEERGLIDVFGKIDMIFQKCQLPEAVKIDTKYYYKQLCEDNEDGSLTRGDIRSGIIIACIYISLKNTNNPIDINDLAKRCGIKKSLITRGLKRITLIEKNKNLDIIAKDENIHYYIHNNCRKFSILNKKDISIIHLLYERLIKLKLIKNNTYKTICAGLIYIYIKHYKIEMNKRDFLSKILITEVTLNKIFNIYNKYEKLLFTGL